MAVSKGKSQGVSRVKAASKPAGRASATERAAGEAASLLIDERIRELGDWRGATLARMRQLILDVDDEIVEEWKWMGTPVWSRHGNICTGETYKKVVKLTFAHGAKLLDPAGLFNSSLEGNTRRAIDIQEGESVSAKAFKALVKAAIAHNEASTTKPKARAKKPAPIKSPKSKKAVVVLLAGGNPQIAKADGDAPVQAYIDAMPGWKRDVGKRLDAIIARCVPRVRKAVKWNSPFYGVEGQGWFLSFHVFTKFVKVTFFNGASLEPLPPGGTERSKDARWVDIREEDELDESQLAKWVKQSAALPGWTP